MTIHYAESFETGLKRSRRVNWPIVAFTRYKMYWNVYFCRHNPCAAYICLWVSKISKGMWHMTGNSQNGPTVHFSHNISQMHGELFNFLTKPLLACHFTNHYTICYYKQWTNGLTRRRTLTIQLFEYRCTVVFHVNNLALWVLITIEVRAWASAKP